MTAEQIKNQVKGKSFLFEGANIKYKFSSTDDTLTISGYPLNMTRYKFTDEDGMVYLEHNDALGSEPHLVELSIYLNRTKINLTSRYSKKHFGTLIEEFLY